MRNKIKIKDGFIIKEYQKDTLLSSDKIISKRIELINSFDYNNFSSLCETKIDYKNGIYIYKQKYFKAQKHIVDIENLYILANSLEYLNNIGFIHGDLNRKNIIYSKDGYKIIDYEPDLYQIKDNIKQTTITIPYLANEDKDNDVVTNLTDKIGFIYFLLRIKGIFKPNDIVYLSKTFYHKKYLGIDENEIKNLNYIKLVEKYIKN